MKKQFLEAGKIVRTHGVRGELAVISAAVAAMGASDGKTYKLRSVRTVKNKPSRSAWSLAGIQNDTNPF